jgi:UDP-N-acetylmuramate: L-alanyl-gamma-D-glutamyl-meso-diaminopimelate ligase
MNTGTALKINIPLMGTHNIMNSLAAAAAAQEIGISDKDIVKGLKTFAGIKRRQEIKGVKNHITIMDDFAHHPTAVRETLAAVKPFYQKGRVIAVFEPRTNSSMRNIFQHIYPAAFDNADLVCVCRPSKIEKIPLSERFSARQLAEDINKRGGKAFYFDNADAIVDFLKLKAAKEDLILIMSNGGFDNIHQKLFDAL